MIPSTHGHFLKSGKVSILKMLPNAVAYFFPSNFLDSGSTASAMCLSSSLLQELTYKGCFSSCIAYIRQGGERGNTKTLLLTWVILTTHSGSREDVNM